ncbi:MAG: Holliday junction resolvase RuvX [Synergistaceae bacterium]|nr:Holliday junction resolvase RuvX [Synergistaceae bacterium]
MVSQNKGRVLALDIGIARIGAAISDPNRIIAQGLGVWNAETWFDDLDDCIKKFAPSIIVAGLPVRTDGKKSAMADKILEILENLKTKYPDINFATQDERFTTVMAQKTLLEADTSRKKRKKTVDKIAAVIILESYLEKTNY